ncbi:unnamed protein product, partial [Laminaria digitata]
MYVDRSQLVENSSDALDFDHPSLSVSRDVLASPAQQMRTSQKLISMNEILCPQTNNTRKNMPTKPLLAGNIESVRQLFTNNNGPYDFVQFRTSDRMKPNERPTRASLVARPPRNAQTRERALPSLCLSLYTASPAKIPGGA